MNCFLLLKTVANQVQPQTQIDPSGNRKPGITLLDLSAGISHGKCLVKYLLQCNVWNKSYQC